MKERGSPGAQLFVGIGFWIFAWHLMPAPDWHLTVKIFVGFLNIVGMVLVMGAITQSARRVGSWWQGLAGRMISVTIVWVMIIGAACYYGTPHVLYEYPKRQPGTCVYFGWKGFARTPATGGSWSGCEAVQWL